MRLLRFRPAIGLIALGVALVFCFDAIGEAYFNEYLLTLGQLTMPTPMHLAFMAMVAFFGGFAALAFTLAFVRLAREGGWLAHILGRWRQGDRAWILGMSALAFLVPLVIRFVLLSDTPVTDDESSYKFAAELLASGRLTIESPPLKLFFDRAFLVNDGQMYSMYFLGWPALMVPGVWLGISGYMNAFYFAFTVPPLFGVARRIVGPSWAKLGLCIFVASPVLLLVASTQLSNTSLMFAVTWSFWFLLRSRDDDAPAWSHAGCAFFFVLAFFIRPTAAIGIGGPVVMAWVFHNRKRENFRAKCVAAFVLTALAGGSLFLYVNKAQNGSITKTGYAREFEYARENGFRFSAYSGDVDPGGPERNALSHFRIDLSPTALVAASGAAAFRVTFASFGLPFALIFLFFTRKRPWAAVLWSMLALHFFIHGFANVPGLDIFGPHRYVSATLPLILLVLIGAKSASHWLGQFGEGNRSQVLRCIPPAFLLVCLALNVRMYFPARADGMVRMANSVHRPLAAVEALGIDNAVVFSPRPYAPPCDIAPTRHYVYWQPANDPALQNPILWVNHIDVPSDRRLMKFFPDRKGYIQIWHLDCTVYFIPLEDADPAKFPSVQIGSKNVALPAYPTQKEKALMQVHN